MAEVAPLNLANKFMKPGLSSGGKEEAWKKAV